MRKLKLFSITLSLCIVVGLLSACGPSLSPPENQETETNTSKAPEGTDQDNDITLQIVDWSDSTKARREEYNKKFMEENPGVKIEYTILPEDQFKTTINSAIKGGSAPDLFPIPSSLKLSTVVEENWYQPLNPYLEDGFLDRFLDGTFNEGITSLDGNLYVFPEDTKIINTLMFYNKNVLQDAGVDINNLPKTQSEFIEVCKQISEAGKGKYYPLIEGGKQVNRLDIGIRALSSLEGSKSNDIGIISLVDGEPVFNKEPMIKAFDFLNELVQNDAFHSDTVNLSAPEARAMFAQNQAAFIIQGSWCIATWRQDNPDLDFGVMPLPVPDDGAKGGLPYIGAQPWMGISSSCKHPEIAAKYLKGLYSEEYQTQLVEDGGFISTVKGINEKHMTDEVMLDYFNLSQEQGKLSPDPIVGNPNAALVYGEVTDINPSLGQIVQGVLSKSITDYKSALDKLAKDSKNEWEKAIEKLASSGVDISKDDFEFKNWDPLVDYTSEDYSNR